MLDDCFSHFGLSETAGKQATTEGKRSRFLKAPDSLRPPPDSLFGAPWILFWLPFNLNKAPTKESTDSSVTHYHQAPLLSKESKAFQGPLRPKFLKIAPSES